MDFLIFLIIVAVVVALIFPKKKRSHGNWKNQSKNNFKSGPQPEKPAEKITQLSVTLSNKYAKKRIINKTEEEVYKLVLRMIYLNAKGKFKINMQTSLGEILTCSSEGHKTINCKRVDFCIMDIDFLPVAVIEVNGTGHYQGDALERDEVKRTAIESAGIKYIAIRENENFKEKLERELIHIFTVNLEGKTIPT